MDESKEILSKLPENLPILIVPGGGVFADFVRSADADDDASHWNAILSMDRYGRFLSTFGYPVTNSLEFSNGVSILLPYKILKEVDPLPHSWEITSDSISAWVASELKSPLVLVKSVSAVFSNALKETDVVDPYVIPFAEKKGIGVSIANGRTESEVIEAIKQATLL